MLILAIILAPASHAFLDGTPDSNPRIGVISSGCQTILYQEDILISAAHCVDPQSPPDSFRIEDQNGDLKTYPILDFIRNGAFTGKSELGDIAVLLLKEPLKDESRFKKLELAVSEALKHMNDSLKMNTVGFVAILLTTVGDRGVFSCTLNRKGRAQVIIAWHRKRTA